MVPSSIKSNLASLRFRERLLTFVWGAACWVAVALLLLLLCGFADWLIDRERETPMVIRLAFFAVQAGAWLLAGLLFVLVPQIRRLPDEMLALWVEAKHRKFDHRLISAVQLNRPHADLQGMSPQLVEVMTREALKEATKIDFPGVADHGRLKWSLLVTLPVFLLVVIPFAIWPGLCFALLGRQALLPIDVPHSVELTSASVEVWPMGDEIPIQYRVKGKWTPEMEGTVSVKPAGDSVEEDPHGPRSTSSRTDRFPLTFIKQDGEDAIFGAEVPAAYSNIVYSARLADGRTRYPSEMQLVPRPTVAKNAAWVMLPEFCGTRPEGGRYELPQPRGDVIGIPGSRVRIQFEVAGPLHKGWIELRGPENFDEKRGEEDAASAEVPKGEPLPMAIKQTSSGYVAEATFDLVEGLSGYRMIVKDEHGFDNKPKPRRAIRLVPEDPPTVSLLRDAFSDGASFDVEGMPVPLFRKDQKKRSQIRIPYICFGAYGLGKAQVLYRVLREHESGKEPEEEETWVRAPLPEVRPDATAGAFDLKTGVFQNSGDGQAVPFHAMPADDPRQLGRTRGGGRVHLDVNGLIDGKGNLRQLKSGDRIEYCIEVYAQHREPAMSTPFARSETRVTQVLDEKAFNAWLGALGKEDERLKALEKMQKSIFEHK